MKNSLVIHLLRGIKFENRIFSDAAKRDMQTAENKLNDTDDGSEIDIEWREKRNYAAGIVIGYSEAHKTIDNLIDILQGDN